MHRYRSNGKYYAVVRHSGKLNRKSLEDEDLKTAKRKLRDFQDELYNSAADARRTFLDFYLEAFVLADQGNPKRLIGINND